MNAVKEIKTYPPHLVVMQNKILQAFYEMTLDEKRMLIIASPIARTIDATEKDAIEILAADYAIACDIDVRSAYRQLEDACKTMMKRFFSYKNERGKRVNVQWVIRSVYEDGAVSMCFTDEVLFMLKVFNQNNPFTKYQKDEVLKLRRDYSIDLYHIFKKAESMKEITITLDDIRSELGLSKAYDQINGLKRRVIDPSIKEISSETDITVTYENVKKGRSIKALKFTIHKKSPPKAVAVSDLERDIPELTEAQIKMFVNKFCDDVGFTSNAPAGQSMSEFKSNLASELRLPKGRAKYKVKLLEAGYSYPKQQGK